MRFFFLLVSRLLSLTTCEIPGASPGAVLLQLQRPSLQLARLEHGLESLVSEVSEVSDQMYHVALAKIDNFPRHAGSENVSMADVALSLEQRALSVLANRVWSRWTATPRTEHRIHGPHSFFTSAVVFDWCLFASAIVLYIAVNIVLSRRRDVNGSCCIAFCMWLIVGCMYNVMIWARFASNAGMDWFAGYLLEFIFMVENIFIFHIVIDAFNIPSVKLTRKALHIVVWAQIMFEMVFFMGLAAWLRSFKALPYLLGIWLICCGILAARGELTTQIDIMQTGTCRAFTACLGDRLSHQYEKDGKCLLRDNTGRLRVSLMGLVVFVLLAADFLLEIDVVLTKIEEIPNAYIAFTSSAVATWSIPELFFLSKGLLKRFVFLKYGISVVLILFGAQMLSSSFYIVRPIVACSIIIAVLAFCIVLSLLDSCCNSKAMLAPPEGEAEDARDAARATTACAKGPSTPAAQGPSQLGRTCGGSVIGDEAQTEKPNPAAQGPSQLGLTCGCSLIGDEAQTEKLTPAARWAETLLAPALIAG